MANNVALSGFNINASTLVGDTSPQLGGNLDLNSNNITGTGNINTTGTVTASGTITGATFSGSGASLTSLPSAQLTGALPAIDGSSLTGINTDLVADTTPQLGGNLDLNSNNITGTGNIETTGSIDITGGMNLTNDTFVGWGGGSQRPAITGNKNDDDMDFYTGGAKQMALTTTYLNLYNSLYLSTGNIIQFEGSSNNEYETTLNVTDPTADRTITLPNQTGTVRVGYQPGEIIEPLETQADGVAVTVQSGTYTPTNVTAIQNLSTSHAVINGSSIGYTPPTGTTRVIYEFWVYMRDTDVGPLLHFAGRVDGTQVQPTRHTWRASTANADYQMWIYSKMILRVGVSQSLSAGDIGTWTSSKTLDFTAREYSSSYEGRFHATNHWDGGGTDLIVKPRIRITAIA